VFFNTFFATILIAHGTHWRPEICLGSTARPEWQKFEAKRPTVGKAFLGKGAANSLPTGRESGELCKLP